MNIILYTKTDCPFCVSARNLLNMLNISYRQIKVGEDITSENYKATIWPTVPGVVIDGVVVGGYTELAQWAVDNHI